MSNKCNNDKCDCQYIFFARTKFNYFFESMNISFIHLYDTAVYQLMCFVQPLVQQIRHIHWHVHVSSQLISADVHLDRQQTDAAGLERLQISQTVLAE